MRDTQYRNRLWWLVGVAPRPRNTPGSWPEARHSKLQRTAVLSGLGVGFFHEWTDGIVAAISSFRSRDCCHDWVRSFSVPSLLEWLLFHWRWGLGPSFKHLLHVETSCFCGRDKAMEVGSPLFQSPMLHPLAHAHRDWQGMRTAQCAPRAIELLSPHGATWAACLLELPSAALYAPPSINRKQTLLGSWTASRDSSLDKGVFQRDVRA